MGSDNGPGSGRRGSAAKVILVVAIICGIGSGGIMLLATPTSTSSKGQQQQPHTHAKNELKAAQQYVTHGLSALSEKIGRVSREGVDLAASREYVEGLASNLVHEVDHAYHQITNTNDDDGRLRDLHTLAEPMAAAVLQGEELLPSEQDASPRQRTSEQMQRSSVVMESVAHEGLLGRLAGQEGLAAAAHIVPIAPSAPKAPIAPLAGAPLGVEHGLTFSSSFHQAALPDAAAAHASALVPLVDPASSLRLAGDAHAERRELNILPLREEQPAELKTMSLGGEGSGYASAKLGASRGFADMWVAQKKERSKLHASCGNMPKAFWPKFSDQREPKTTTKVYSAKDGTVMPMGLDGKQARVRTEHGKRGRRSATNKRRLKTGEQALVECLNNLGRCSSSSMRAALALRGMREALTSKHKLLPRKYQSCAVVGNSGGMMHHKYGRYIDTHDFVMRINILETKSRRENLGEKVSGRVLSYKMSKDVCCIQKDYRADNPDLEYFIWFPASRSQVKDRMKKKLKTNPVHIMSPGFVNSAVLAFKTFRGEMLRLGYGPFEDWEYMTSGMHAVLGMIRSCENVDVYGFTTDVNTKGPYWFTGRAVPPRSGKTQHAWDHERMTLRLLHAAGAINASGKGRGNLVVTRPCKFGASRPGDNRGEETGSAD